MNKRAAGPFDVKLNPEPLALEDVKDGAARGRMSLDKHYHGDLEAASKGEMLTAMTGTQGSAGYVAIEKVQGTLGGRAGTFALQHNATMTLRNGSPRVIVALCCSANVPLRPCNVPSTFSIAT